jgi:hypothetical protein
VRADGHAASAGTKTSGAGGFLDACCDASTNPGRSNQSARANGRIPVRLNDPWYEISLAVAPDAHAVLIMDQAEWHTSKKLEVPDNITIVTLPPRAPELNPVENVWQFMRDNWLSARQSRQVRSRRHPHTLVDELLQLSEKAAVGGEIVQAEAECRSLSPSRSGTSTATRKEGGFKGGNGDDDDDDDEAEARKASCEKWKPAVGYPGYLVSDRGHVKSIKTPGWQLHGKIIKPVPVGKQPLHRQIERRREDAHDLHSPAGSRGARRSLSHRHASYPLRWD